MHAFLRFVAILMTLSVFELTTAPAAQGAYYARYHHNILGFRIPSLLGRWRKLQGKKKRIPDHLVDIHKGKHGVIHQMRLSNSRMFSAFKGSITYSKHHGVLAPFACVKDKIASSSPVLFARSLMSLTEHRCEECKPWAMSCNIQCLSRCHKMCPSGRVLLKSRGEALGREHWEKHVGNRESRMAIANNGGFFPYIGEFRGFCAGIEELNRYLQHFAQFSASSPVDSEEVVREKLELLTAGENVTFNGVRSIRELSQQYTQLLGSFAHNLQLRSQANDLNTPFTIPGKSDPLYNLEKGLRQTGSMPLTIAFEEGGHAVTALAILRDPVSKRVKGVCVDEPGQDPDRMTRIDKEEFPYARSCEVYIEFAPNGEGVYHFGGKLEKILEWHPSISVQGRLLRDLERNLKDNCMIKRGCAVAR